MLKNNTKKDAAPFKMLSKRQKLSFLFFPVLIIYMELIFKLLTTPDFFNLGLVFVPLYSVAAGILFGAVCSCFSEKVNNILARCFSFALSLIYSTQVVYHWCHCGNNICKYNVYKLCESLTIMDLFFFYCIPST